MKDEIKEILDKLKELCYDDYCLEFSVDYIERKEEKILLDYITNLQKENEILKKNAEHNDKVVDKAKWNEMLYKSRNEKAIEYIRSDKWGKDYKNSNCRTHLLNILEGNDKK